jgi:hypothetical protein
MTAGYLRPQVSNCVARKRSAVDQEAAQALASSQLLYRGTAYFGVRKVESFELRKARQVRYP